MRILVIIWLIFGLTAPISACGKKGDPKPPEVKSSEYPRVYPQ